ncbi:MAG: hypothetical protein J6B25_01005 [Clostridia bacterium]|nr:hypothetical protein [Clostridia bacterium]
MAYNYNNSSAAYDLDMFAPAPRQVPQRKPELRPQPRLVKPQVKTKQEIRAEAAAIRAKMIKFVAVLTAGIVLLGANVALHIQDNELNNAIVKLDKELGEKKSEYTRLTAVFNSKFSPDNAKAYAEEHGMVKRERYQIVYFDIDEGNQIISAE